MVTTKDVEAGNEALLPYDDGWKAMLHLLTPEFRQRVMERYKYKDVKLSNVPSGEHDTDYDTDTSIKRYPIQIPKQILRTMRILKHSWNQVQKEGSKYEC